MLSFARSPVPPVLLCFALAVGCASRDPQREILEQRARWNVSVLNWAEDQEGNINVDTRVSGPPRSSLRQLTVRVDLLDAAGNRVGRHWHTYDLSQVPRGGPSDLFIRIPSRPGLADGLTLSLVLDPTPEEARHIRELQP